MGKVSKIWSTVERKWYEELKMISPYREYQYDRSIQSHLQTLFPEYIAIPYGRTVLKKGEDKGNRPDFALIRKDFAEWWIVEVERIEDKISHVRKQIETFINGEYNAMVEAKYISKHNKKLNFSDIYPMTQNPPNVLMIVDDMSSEWQEEFKNVSVSICILKIFRNQKGDLYNISGDYPYIYEDSSNCHFSDAMQNLLKLLNPDILNPIIKKPVKRSIFQIFFDSNTKGDSSDTYRINHRGQISEWKRIDSHGETYLQPVGPVDTRVNDGYILKRTSTNLLILELL
jgi:hypothetical protein